MKSKKAMEFEVLVKIIIVLVVLIVSIAIYLKYTNKSTGTLDREIDKLDDKNNNGVADILETGQQDNPKPATQGTKTT
ncbi:hypothetical protein J4419_01470 [Candidatus Woesearchaeota archaeon]|nr:hypothetical protein [Candidatus Woesearchaeota archaeon]